MMKKTLSVVGALFLAGAMACGGSKKDETMTPPPVTPTETMTGDAGMGAPSSAAPTGNPCSTGATASGNPCSK